MKIRFGANDTIDTQTAGSPANYDEVEYAAIDAKESLDDNSSSFEDQTQLNILKRFVKGFLVSMSEGSGQGELKNIMPDVVNHIYLEFDDVVSSISDGPGWAGLAEAIQYDEAQSEDEGE